MAKYTYGWKKDIHDPRDLKLSVPRLWASLPPSIDLRTSGFMPPVYDQGQVGSCTANSIGAAWSFEHSKQGEPYFMPSRLFIYANERIMEGTPLSDDSGAQIRDGVKSVAQLGVCSEETWPYLEDKYSIKPPQPAYDEALNNQATQYLSVSQDTNSLKAVLAAGQPICFGFTVYESFESATVAQTGLVPMPNTSTEQCLGGHAVLLVGYQADGSWIVRNSWGPSWGISGYCIFPQQYLTNPSMASDFWVIKKVE